MNNGYPCSDLWGYTQENPCGPPYSDLRGYTQENPCVLALHNHSVFTWFALVMMSAMLSSTLANGTKEGRYRERAREEKTSLKYSFKLEKAEKKLPLLF